jgi:lipopolysaccharide/colanic/teichoic acid biosynthesis glycosyltransferase
MHDFHAAGATAPPRAADSTDIDVPALVNRSRSLDERLVKPTLDRVLASLLLLVLAPVVAGVAIAVWTRLGKPILLRQERVARGGGSFPMYKFRTMLPSRRSQHAPFHGPDRRRTHKHPNDPRHTRLGRFLRAYSSRRAPPVVQRGQGRHEPGGPAPGAR